jgi:small-conductance mechanosensitive channel
MPRHVPRLVLTALLALLGVGCGGSLEERAGRVTGEAAPEPAAPGVAVPSVAAAASAPREVTEPEAISPAEVPRAAEQADTRLREIRLLLRRGGDIAAIERSLAATEERIHALQEAWSRDAERQRTRGALRSFRQEWGLLDETLQQNEGDATRRARGLASARADLLALVAVWSKTHDSLAGGGAAADLAARSLTIVAGAKDTLDLVEGELDRTLRVQNNVSIWRLEVSDGEASVDEQLEAARRELFVRESPPLWRALRAGAPSATVRDEIVQAWAETIRSFRAYVGRESARLFWQLALFLGFAALLKVLGRRSRPLVDPATEAGEAWQHLISRPLLAAALVALLSARWLHPRAPVAFFEVTNLVFFPFTIAFMYRVVAKSMRPPLVVLGVFYFFDQIRDVAAPNSGFYRILLLVVSVAGLAAIVWALRTHPREATPLQGTARRVARIVGRLSIVGLTLSIVLNVLGNVTLAQVLTKAAIRGAYIALVLLGAVFLARGISAALIRLGSEAGVRALGRHAAALEAWISRILGVVGVAFWCTILAGVLGLFGSVADLGRQVLSASLSLGAVRMTLGDVVAFVLTIYVATLISRVARALLADDVFPRVPLGRGVPETLMMVVRYGLVAMGFILALAIAGVPLDRVTLLASALSVGIGFGLQAVVSNFVSGIILSVERPIYIGDVVGISGIEGTVRSIGARATTIRTFDGAEVIVPNGFLVSNQLVNWTLSDRHRRIEVTVGVRYGSDPEQVAKILCEAARAHRQVLSKPEPAAPFMKFGDSALEFNLRFWTQDFDDWIQIRSDVLTAVHAKLTDAGIEIPFPQRDVHLKRPRPS